MNEYILALSNPVLGLALECLQVLPKLFIFGLQRIIVRKVLGTSLDWLSFSIFYPSISASSEKNPMVSVAPAYWLVIRASRSCIAYSSFSTL
jgi:hypothetical protein